MKKIGVFFTILLIISCDRRSERVNFDYNAQAKNWANNMNYTLLGYQCLHDYNCAECVLNVKELYAPVKLSCCYWHSTCKIDD